MNDKANNFVCLIEFEHADALIPAIRQVRAAGFVVFDVYTPFPMEDVSAALGLHSRPIHRVTLIAGIVGAIGGFTMCWYANVIGYRWNIGGRPFNSWPAWIPITFEMLVLFAGLSAAISMLYFNGLPRLHCPVFELPAFARASRDRFFLAINLAPLADLGRLREVLATFAPVSISMIQDCQEGST